MASQRGYTAADYRSLPDEVRAELLEGALVMVPAPGRAHQVAVGELFVQLREYARRTGAFVAMAPLDVWLADDTVAQPDLVLVTAVHLGRVGEDGVHGPPDLVVEVVSPSSRDRDTGQKVEVYARAGVPEYWVVDPGERWAGQYVLDGPAYRFVGRCQGLVAAATLPDLVVRLDW